MDKDKESRQRKDKYDDRDDYRRERRYKKKRSRSRSPREDRDKSSKRKRKQSRSRSPNNQIKNDKGRNDAPKQNVESKPEAPVRKAKETDMLNTRTGGAYIPPARLRMMQAQITDKASVAYQRLAWEALKKSIHGHINKINVGNIGIIIKELLKENIVRGRGLLCRSVIQAQAASPTFTNVYAALVAAVNSRFPNIGELLLKRLVIQFKRGFKRNDKPTCISSASFIAHLVNQRVAHEILALELLTLLVETPTDDSVEVSIAFLKECGQKLTEVSSKGVNAIFEMLRNILHEGQLDKRVQYMIEVMFQVWKDGFKDHPAVVEELELVPEEEQFTHLLMLDDATDSQDILNVFKFDDKYEENEEKYKALSKEILGSDAESGEDGSDESGSEESDDEEGEDKQKEMTIIDNTETNLIALRRTIYLTINSSLDFEECAHKLMKMQLKPGQEIELCHMFLDCCAEQRTYEKFYGLLAQRFCNINRIYIGPFEEIFKDSYSTAHRLDTNRLRNVSKFFAHLLFTDSISWEALECVKLNEEDTTSSSRIYIKILFQELAEYMGLKKLNDRLKDPTLQEAFSGIFPRDNPKNTRFSINFFTSIGLGGLTDELREHLKQMPKNVPAPVTEIKLDSSSDSSSSSSDSSSSSSSDSSSSDSEDENKKKEKKGKKKKKPTTPEPDQSPKQKDADKTERWGHDGFYDTYGQDARRNVSRNDRMETRDPRGRRHEERGRDDFEHRNGRREERRDREYDAEEPRRHEKDRRKETYSDSRERPRDDSRRKNYENPEDRRDDREFRRNGEDRNNRNEPARENRRDRDRYGGDRDDDVETRRSKRDKEHDDKYRKEKEREESRNSKNYNEEKSNRDRYAEKNDKTKSNGSDDEDPRYERHEESKRQRYVERETRRREGSEDNKKHKRNDKNKDYRSDDDDPSRFDHRGENRNDKRVDRESRKKENSDDYSKSKKSHKDKNYGSQDEERTRYKSRDDYNNEKNEQRESRKKDKSDDNKKRNKGKKKDKENHVTDTDSSDTDSEKNVKTGRYWDNFDIESAVPKEKDRFEDRTPEKIEKSYGKRRER